MSRFAQFRNLGEEDHGRVVAVADVWWGRPVASNLPRLFFRHFADTSFAVEEEGELVAFLVGFVSQARPEEAYVHFVGVHPEFRGRGLATELYWRFFEEVRRRGCRKVRCITSPINEGSVAFHRRLGFELERGDSVEGGVPVHTGYDGEGKSRVAFSREV